MVLFFFFKQKTAYEISACLVGSEMCIRDRNNVADVLISGTDDRKKIRNAAETLYQLQDTDLFSFFSTELSTQSQLEKLLKENMPNGKETSKQSLEQIGIDWNKYM